MLWGCDTGDIGENEFLFLPGIAQGGGSSAPVVEHIGHHRLGGVHHPLVALGNGEVRWNRLQRRIDAVVIAGTVLVPVEIGPNQNQLYVWMGLFLFAQDPGRQFIKRAVPAQIKGGGALLN